MRHLFVEMAAKNVTIKVTALRPKLSQAILIIHLQFLQFPPFPRITVGEMIVHFHRLSRTIGMRGGMNPHDGGYIGTLSRIDRPGTIFDAH
jgi:hypothetical protein